LSFEAENFDLDRAQGVLVGLAAGDKILGPLEMSLMVAESLVARREYDLADITKRWLDWWRRGAWDMGRVFDEVMAMIDTGAEPDMAATEVHEAMRGKTAGCNGAHRVPVLAACAVITDNDFDEAARTLTARTHHHVLAQDAAVVVARLCRRLIKGATADVALNGVADGLDPIIQASVDKFETEPGGIGGYSPETVQSALHFVFTRMNFKSALEDALRYAGPPNYSPVLVGAIAGARWGMGEIDQAHLSHCRDLERVTSTAKSLANQNYGK